MSKGERDNLELEINRYLDGDISDEEFERFLKDRPEDIDLERLQALKSRVERIEGLYRQIEEPAVPDGYWDHFADRVEQKLPGATNVTLTDRILSFVLPWRWPVVAYGYAGAVASVLLIFFIGKTVQETGKDVYAPLPIESVSRKSRMEEPEDQVKSVSPAPDVSEPRSSGTEKFRSDVTLEIAGTTQDLGKGREGAPAAPEQAVEVSIREQKTAAAEVKERMEPEGGMEENGRKEPSQPSTDEQILEVVVNVPASENVFKESESVVEDKLLPNIRTDPEHVGTLPEEETVVIQMDKGRRGKGELPAISLAESDVVTLRAAGEDTLRGYDDLDLYELHSAMKLGEATFTDSSYTGQEFLEYVEMKAVLALTTRDSTDTREAIDAIDTLLKYNPSIDKELWLKRRSAVQSVTPSPAKP